jgi:citrate lyase beta subunit
LSRGEIEFIAKVNKEQLMFCEDSLPEWANDEALLNAERSSNLDDVDQMTFMNPLHKDNNQEMPSAVEMSSVFEVPKTDQEALKK